jgi:GntR family transcriptional regulator of arabinose operon
MRAPAYSKARDWIVEVVFNKDSKVKSIPSERHLSTMLGVSRDTLRRAIRDLTAEGILESRQGLGTYVNRVPIDKHLQKSPKGISVGIMIGSGLSRHSLDNYLWLVMQSAVNTLSERGIRTSLISVSSTGIFATKEIMSHKVDGLIWIAPPEQCMEIIKYLKEKGIPVISVGGTIDLKKCHYVATDDYTGGFMAGEYLVKKGHKKILFVSEVKSRPFTVDRFRGFNDALSKYGVKTSKEFTIMILEVTSVYETVRKYIRDNVDFSAVFCADGIYLRAVYNAIRDEGKNIPGDYSLISYDKSNSGECSGLNVVEVIQPLEKLGKTASKELTRLLTGKRSAIVRDLFKPAISEGDSCRSIKWE